MGGKEEQREGSPWGLGLGEGGKQGPTNQAKALYTFIYIYIIVGNCTKCCRKMLNTRECKAKHNSK